MLIQGRRPIAGISNNNAAGLLDLTFTWVTVALADITAAGQIVPISGSLSHSADIKIIKDNRGNEVTIITTNEKVILEVMAVPLGVGVSTENSLAAAESAARFPMPGSWLTIGAAPVIDCGTFTDVFNSNAYTYNCDGRLEIASEGEWGMRFSVTRRLYMPRTAGVVI